VIVDTAPFGGTNASKYSCVVIDIIPYRDNSILNSIAKSHRALKKVNPERESRENACSLQRDRFHSSDWWAIKYGDEISDSVSPESRYSVPQNRIQYIDSLTSQPP